MTENTTPDRDGTTEEHGDMTPQPGHDVHTPGAPTEDELAADHNLYPVEDTDATAAEDENDTDHTDDPDPRLFGTGE